MANNNISFRGEVNEMSAAYFIREMEKLPARSSANIYLHTPGGDVYAGGEMVNALRAALKRGCKVSVEVGSLCASMGAALLAAAKASGCKAKCHPNSEVMFHGCWTIMVGGADELTDQAKAMRDFNECVRRDLKKCGIEDTEEWFAADRQKWLNAEDLKTCGLVDEIMDEESADPDDLKDSAVKIAALLNHPQQETKMEDQSVQAEEKPVEAAPAATEDTPGASVPPESDGSPTTETTTEQPPEPTPAEPQATPEPLAENVSCGDSTISADAMEAPEVSAAEVTIVTDEAFEARVKAAANERFAKLQAKHDKMICDLVKERDAALKDLEAAKAVSTSLQADIEKLEADLAACRDQLTQSERNRESIVVDALAPAAELPTMEDGLAACKTLAERAAFLNAGKFKTH